MRTVSEPGMGTLEIFALDTSESFLHDLIGNLFEDHWCDIVFGSLIQGAVFEIRAPNAPTRISPAGWLSHGQLRGLAFSSLHRRPQG